MIIRSDRIDVDFSVNRQSSIGNTCIVLLMSWSRANGALALFSISYLDSMESHSHNNMCSDMGLEDATVVETCTIDISLSETEEYLAV